MGLSVKLKIPMLGIPEECVCPTYFKIKISFYLPMMEEIMVNKKNETYLIIIEGLGAKRVEAIFAKNEH